MLVFYNKSVKSQIRYEKVGLERFVYRAIFHILTSLVAGQLEHCTINCTKSIGSTFSVNLFYGNFLTYGLCPVHVSIPMLRLSPPNKTAYISDQTNQAEKRRNAGMRKEMNPFVKLIAVGHILAKTFKLAAYLR